MLVYIASIERQYITLRLYRDDCPRRAELQIAALIHCPQPLPRDGITVMIEGECRRSARCHQSCSSNAHLQETVRKGSWESIRHSDRWWMNGVDVQRLSGFPDRDGARDRYLRQQGTRPVNNVHATSPSTIIITTT